MESQTYKRIRTLLDHLKLNPGRDGHSADSKPRSEDRKSIFFPVRPYVDRYGPFTGRHREILTIQFLPKGGDS